MALKDSARSWLLNLPSGSISSWDEMRDRFIANFQGTRDRPPAAGTCGVLGPAGPGAGGSGCGADGADGLPGSAIGAGATTGRKLVGLKGLGRRAGRSHYPVLKDGSVVGEVTSGQPSPTLGYPIALAYVDVELSEPGTALDIDLRGKAEPFEVVALPFYKRSK